MNTTTAPRRLRICAVSYLNTVPLVWGLLHGAARGRFELIFRVPAECADLLAAGEADIGIVPTFELLRQPLETVPGVGIACRGAVRSILMVSRVEAGEIRTLAADASSRSSVALARIVLERRYGAVPRIVSMAPDLDAMLAQADAALLIGDPALRVEPAGLPYGIYDLGQEWMQLTGLPMVFAMWAGRRECLSAEVVREFQDSCREGLRNLDAIVAAEAGARAFAPGLVRRYLTEHIVFELGAAEAEGLRRFLAYARELPAPAERWAGRV